MPVKAFSSEACPALDAGWVPVRAKKTHQTNKVYHGEITREALKLALPRQR
jgi:hypothetical protein